MEVTAKEIHEAYKANAIRADQKYKGKMVQIEGVSLQSPFRQPEGNLVYNLVVVSGNHHGSGFVCYFDDTHQGELAELLIGQIIAVVGILDGDRHMRKCKFVEPKPTSLKPSASQFYQEAQEDRHLFDARYKGKTVQITGKAAEATVGFGTVGVLEFDCGAKPREIDPRAQNLICRFEEPDQGPLKDISKGQTVTVQGTFNGLASGLYLENCKLVK